MAEKISPLKSLGNKIKAGNKRVLKKLFSGRRAKRQHLHAMAEDIVEITKQFDDHVFSFPPHSSVGGMRLYTSAGYNRVETQAVLDFLARENKLSPKAIALELGGNIGTQTIYFALQGVFRKIISVEVDSKNLYFLEKNVVANGFADLIDIVPVALADYDGETAFYKSAHNDGSHSRLDHAASSDGEIVACKRLATIIKECGIASADIEFVWSDLEGIDYEAFLQFKDFGFPQTYFVEFSPNFMTPTQTDAFKHEIFAAYHKVYQSVQGRFIEVGADDIPQRKQSNLLLTDPK